MSLGITVGRLAYFLADGYAEGVTEIERDLGVINQLLTENGLPGHTEPRTRPQMLSRSPLDHMPYDWFARIQRAVAFSWQTSKKFAPTRKNAKPWENSLVRSEQKRFRSHLICHSVEGYFVPVDFLKPLPVMSGQLAGQSLGSCHGAMRELVTVAPLLGISLEKGQLSDASAKEISKESYSMEPGPLYAEREAWLILFESFRLSIEHNMSVCFH